MGLMPVVLGVPAPPPSILGVVLAGLCGGGRYEVEWAGGIEWLDAERDLRSWLCFAEASPLLIDIVIKQVKAVGICSLNFKEIYIRDTQWVKPLSKIDWSMFKSKF